MSDGISSEDLWAQITAIPRPHRLVDFPRLHAETKPDGSPNPEAGKPITQIAMLVLLQEETEAAAAEAEKKTRARLRGDDGSLPGKDDLARGYVDVYNNAASVETLFRACKHPSDPELKKPFFRTPSDIRKYLTNDEVGVLMNSYLRVKAELSPVRIGWATDEEIEAFLVALAKAGSLHPLDGMSWGALMILVGYSVKRLAELLTASSSSSPLLVSGESVERTTPVGESPG